MKYAPPSDAQERRRRLLQLDLQRDVVDQYRTNMLSGSGPLEEWERVWLVEMGLSYLPGDWRKEKIKARLARV